MNNNRIFFIDNLRAFVVFLVVVLHGALSYMEFAPEWWYVLNPQRSLFFTAVVILVDIPIMQIMFFAAGYFAFGSLAKRGAGKFLQEKLVRIGLPWLFGALVLAPPTTYLIYYTRQVPVSLAQFWANDFWGPLYQQSVYWFLGILMLQFGLMAALYTLSQRFRGWQKKAAAPSWQLFVGFWAVTTVCYLFMNQFFGMDEWWTRLYLFVIQPVRSPLYFAYFMLGVYAGQNGWFTGGHRAGWGWVALFVLSGVVYLGYRFTVPAPYTGVMLSAVNAMLFNLFCLSGLMGGAAIFQRYVNGNGRFWSSQARNSYGVYYIHPLILYPLVYLFVPITMSIYLKAFIVIMLGWLLSWAFTALILTKVPGLRRIF
jgi:hypothetical protein